MKYIDFGLKYPMLVSALVDGIKMRFEFFRLRQAPFIAYQSKQNLTLDVIGT